jgi:hypothetical protein
MGISNPSYHGVVSADSPCLQESSFDVGLNDDIGTKGVLYGSVVDSDPTQLYVHHCFIEVPPYVGYMFELTALADIDLLTLELDIRFDLNPSDLLIQVYAVEGYYGQVIDQPDAWTKLAETYLVAEPSGNSAIIPTKDFNPLHIPIGEKRSLYVTMKGPYMDHHVHALQKEGDVHVKGDDMQLQVGTGFNSHGFPSVPDQTLHPQFAGVIHYAKSVDCGHAKVSTTTVVDFPFLFEMSELDDSFVSAVNGAIDRAVETWLFSNAALASFVKEYNMEKPAVATTERMSYGSKLSSLEYATLVLRCSDLSLAPSQNLVPNTGRPARPRT